MLFLKTASVGLLALGAIALVVPGADLQKRGCGSLTLRECDPSSRVDARADAISVNVDGDDAHSHQVRDDSISVNVGGDDAHSHQARADAIPVNDNSVGSHQPHDDAIPSSSSVHSIAARLILDPLPSMGNATITTYWAATCNSLYTNNIQFISSNTCIDLGSGLTTRALNLSNLVVGQAENHRDVHKDVHKDVTCTLMIFQDRVCAQKAGDTEFFSSWPTAGRDMCWGRIPWQLEPRDSGYGSVMLRCQ